MPLLKPHGILKVTVSHWSIQQHSVFLAWFSTFISQGYLNSSAGTLISLTFHLLQMEGLDAVDIISAAWQLLTARRDFHCALATYIFPDRAVARFFCTVTVQKWDNLLTLAIKLHFYLPLLLWLLHRCISGVNKAASFALPCCRCQDFFFPPHNK